jgi:hypothetical protein
MTPRLRTAISAALVFAMFALSGGATGADCVLNTNPACANAINLGTVSGDAATPGISRSGTGEAFFKVYVQETSSAHPRPLNARVVLQVPDKTDYDLVVRCASCASTVTQMSKAGVAKAEVIHVTRADTFADNSYWIVIEVRHYAGTGCGNWLLTINGNSPATQGALACT